MEKHDSYESPLASRYAGRQMSFIWSAQNKHCLWRKLWLELAKAEKTLGLEIEDSQIAEMQDHLQDIDFGAVARKESELKHDVMSHIHVFGELCPKARPIIHLGATSCFVTDNSEIIQMRDSLRIIKGKILAVISKLADFADKYKSLPTLGFTHYQPAQLTTPGKRAVLYIQDFLFDLDRLEHELENLPFIGVKGTTGTQASFLELFDGDHVKVKLLDAKIAKAMGFEKSVAVSGQTYTRKADYYVVSVLSGTAQSAYKFAGDLRLLANLKELEEPFGSKQVGSSAMAYKRNPMKSERICSLARYVISLTANPANTHACQWFERTLDDSANRRIVLPEAFLATDIILSTLADIADGLQVWPKVIEADIRRELPFMATENILMAAVKAGGDRQELHEAIRTHSMEAGRRVKEFGEENDLIRRIKSDTLFAKIANKIDTILDPAKFIGRAPQQVDEFLSEEVRPVLKKYDAELKEALKKMEKTGV